MFENRCIVVGVTGGIAAFKAASLVSLFNKQGADVHVIMTQHATEFVTPLTFETLSQNPVITSLFQRETPYEVEHISLAQKADLMVIAPATANFLAKAAEGISDDMLLTTWLAATCPKVIAPAMNSNMYADEATQKNISSLRSRGFFVMGTGHGRLACGTTGEGRMAEPEEIAAACEEAFRASYDLAGRKILVTAGPTQEAIDPVRFISSPSSGKMGYAVAERAAARGAQVTLVSGPVTLKPPAKTRVIRVKSTQEMYDAVLNEFDSTQIVIKAAAVADYTPKVVSDRKMKKAGDMVLELTRTQDILLELGKRRKNQVLVGFAAETNDIMEYARRKLKEKNLDVIAANDVSKEGCGFGTDTNRVILHFRDGHTEDLGFSMKREIADQILTRAEQLFCERETGD